MVFLFVGLYNKPDYSITDWSAQEVFRRTQGQAVLLHSPHIVQQELQNREKTYHDVPQKE